MYISIYYIGKHLKLRIKWKYPGLVCTVEKNWTNFSVLIVGDSIHTYTYWYTSSSQEKKKTKHSTGRWFFGGQGSQDEKSTVAARERHRWPEVRNRWPEVRVWLAGNDRVPLTRQPWLAPAPSLSSHSQSWWPQKNKRLVLEQQQKTAGKIYFKILITAIIISELTLVLQKEKIVGTPRWM